MRYFDYLGHVLDAWGKTGGQQGDPLEMIVFKALRQRYAGTRFEEQRQLHLPQKHKATVQDSALLNPKP